MQNNEPKKNLVNKILLTIKKCDCLKKTDHNASPVAIFFNSYVLLGVSQTPITKSRHFTILPKRTEGTENQNQECK